MRIFRFLWGIYCFIVLAPIVIITASIVWILTVMFGAKSKVICLKIAQKISCNIICWLSLIIVKVHGRKQFQKGIGYVVIGNHNSNYDIFINSTTLPWHSVFCFLSKAELGQTPFFGIIAKNLAVLVDRKSVTSKMKSFAKMKQVLLTGISVWIFPEGTRNKSNDYLLEFADGAFTLAIDMKVPIIVNTLVGVKHINNANYTVDMSPGVVHCFFEEPIDTTQMTKADIPMLKEKVRTTMLARLHSHR